MQQTLSTSGVTQIALNPTVSNFGAHLNELGLLYQEYHFNSLELELFPNGLASSALSYAPVPINSSVSTLAQMTQMQNYIYGNQYLTRPWSLRLTKGDLDKGLFRWYQTNSAFTNSAYQGQIYVYQGTSDSCQVRLSYNITFRAPASTGITSYGFLPIDHQINDSNDEKKEDGRHLSDAPATPYGPPQ
jgi:hypothetical protein